MNRRRSTVSRLTRTLVGLVTAGALTGCPGTPFAVQPGNPFTDLAPVPLDGQARPMASGVASLGTLPAGDVVRLNVIGQGIDAVLVLAEDAMIAEAGVVVGGGRANEPFQHRAAATGVYLVLVLFNPAIAPSLKLATLEASPGDPAFASSQEQIVLVTFDEDFLTAPGLFDPTSGAPDELAFLQSIGDLVRADVLNALRATFAGTPIEIVSTEDPSPAAPFSRLRFSGQRVSTQDTPAAEDVVIPITPDPRCNQGVVFGELLPANSRRRDPGNQTPDDEAIVYVGSFQGRGEACQSAVVNSINNIILALSHTGAHEIGHLVGLFHVASFDDIMVVSPNLAFQRELTFGRSQIQLGPEAPGSTIFPVLTNVIQDPNLYFDALFPQ